LKVGQWSKFNKTFTALGDNVLKNELLEDFQIHCIEVPDLRECVPEGNGTKHH
jgi:hypothetical protein